jgi:hypothetical protein
MLAGTVGSSATLHVIVTATDLTNGQEVGPPVSDLGLLISGP